MRLTGMPVQALTTSAISSSVTSWRSSRLSAGFSSAVLVGRGDLLFERLPLVVELEQLLIVVFAGRNAGGLLLLDLRFELLSIRGSTRSRSLRSFCTSPTPSFSASHCSRRLASLRLMLGDFGFDLGSRCSTADSSVSSASCREASSSCISRRCTSSISVGTLSSSIASLLAASSTRSIALSGRKRSVM